jgi:hypothetical protein
MAKARDFIHFFIDTAEPQKARVEAALCAAPTRGFLKPSDLE